ncbi:MAG: DEAD/DEAH box helicase, partial [Alphaproteobacteria bacterium]
MTLFTELQLRPEIMRALDQCSFTEATPIQAATIPLALAGRDILGTAQTGTGKTAAFGIPLITRLLDNPQEAALVLTPTRELATQVLTTLRNLIDRETRMRVALLIGGDSMTKQLAQLHAKPRLIVATPGRLNDHLRRQSVSLRNVRFLVLDETDRMLDMGFGIQIDDILHHMPQSRQTLLFSATLPGNIMQLAGRYMNNPERIAVGSVNTPAADIEQETLHMPQSEKYRRLVEQLDQREGSVIVFVRTKNDADHLSAKLQELNYSADALHGDLRQRQRDRAIKAFRAQQTRIMVATDIAARGLDIPHIEHVINYDMPQCPEDYVHRIGRTARAGAHGSALNFVSPHDSKKWHAICRMLQPKDGSGSSYGGSHGGSSRAPGRSGEYSSRPKRQGDARTPYANKNAERTSSSPYAPKKDFGRPERANRDGFDSRKPREDRPRDGYNAPSANGYQGKDRPHREGQAERTPFRKPREDG